MLDFTRLDKVRRQRPLIHCVSNIVTANDCANLALAVGASPMMAQAPEEMEAISAVSDATVLNTGTPDAEKFRACRICAVSARSPKGFRAARRRCPSLSGGCSSKGLRSPPSSWRRAAWLLSFLYLP